MELGIQLHAAGLSLLDTTPILAGWGVDWCPSTVHNWVQKAGLEPVGDKQPNHVAVDETVIQLNNQRFWLYAVLDPDTNEFLHGRLVQIRTTVLTNQFLQELREKHEVADSLFLVDGAPWLQAALFELELRFQHVTYRHRNAVKRVIKGLKRRTEHFATHFGHATADSAETWLQTFAFTRN